MRYIRTKDEIYKFRELVGFETYLVSKRDNEYSESLYRIEQKDIIKKADTIEELCDEKVAIRKSNHKPYLGHFNGTFLFQEDSGWLGRVDSYETIYGAIWTEKGLIYVAKMNDKGELELI